MANNGFSFVDDLNASRDLFNMKVRVIKKWRQSFRLDYIFLDEKGKKIQACVREDLMPQFEDQLKEDGVYVIRKFGVGEQRDKYKVLKRDIKININRCTTIQPVTAFQGDLYGFEFVSFDDILGNQLKEALTVDVIGRMIWCGGLDVFKGEDKDVKRVNFDLQNLEGKILKCTVWGDYAVQINKFISGYTSNEMIIAIMQHGKIKPWDGNITVQNHFNATRIFLNEDIEQVNELRRSLILKDDGSSCQTQYSAEINYPLRHEFLEKYQRKYIDQLMDCPKETFWVVLARIKLVEQEPGWFYVACRKCNRKPSTKQEYLKNAVEINEDFMNGPEDSLWCFTCKSIATALIPKFRVQFRVQDSTGSISFVMFDKDVYRIVGLSANDIRAKQVKSDNMDKFPRELDILLDKLLAFIVKVSSYNVASKTYTVYKFTDDPEIVSELENAGSHEVSETCYLKFEPSYSGIELKDNQQLSEMSSVRLGESSQGGAELKNETQHLIQTSSTNLGESSQDPVDSKDCASVTGGYLGVDVDKDSVNSPLGKRSAASATDRDQASTTKRARKKLMPYNV